MDASNQTMYEELVKMRRDIDFIKHIISEDYELSEEAKKSLKEAREIPESDYADL